MYETVLRNFSNFPKLRLNPPAPMKEMILLALDSEEGGWQPEDGSKEDIATFIVNLLSSRADMLQEYFSIDISKSLHHCIPCLPDCVHGVPHCVLE